MDLLRGERGLVPGGATLCVQDSVGGTIKGRRATTTCHLPAEFLPILTTAGLSAEQKEDQSGGIPAHISLCSAPTAGFPFQKFLLLPQSS